MMENVNFDEAKQSQLPAVELLLALGFQYISVDEVLRQRGGDTSRFLLAEIAAQKLMEINDYELDGTRYKFSEKDVRDAVEELEHLPLEGLNDTAQKIFNMIMPTSGGKTIKVQAGGKVSSQNFRYIDLARPQNNAFHVTVEYAAQGKQNIRPDIVCFVNGIPLAVIECKKSAQEPDKAVKQMVRNQGPEYCPKLFAYSQLLVATNDKDFLYGTTGTPKKFYATWKEKGTSAEDMDARVSELIAKPIDPAVYRAILDDLNGHTAGHRQKTDRLPTAQDRGIAALFAPARFLDLAKNYILFDAGVKKLSRYQQYFAIRKMLDRVEEMEAAPNGQTRRGGGLVWHTQGTGKSLTMVMFVKALIEHPHITNPRVIIVTDRKDLDKQIKDTFQNCNLKKAVIQMSSGSGLLGLIKEKDLSVITTTVHKFKTAADVKAGFVDFDQNIFVLIDEAHRTQYGIANLEMNRIIPNACYIGFTGTPLLKNDKSWLKFGGYIDTYTIDDGLQDKIILPLVYEGRYVIAEANIPQIDKHADRVEEDAARRYDSSGLSAEQKKKAQKEITKKVIQNNPQVVQEIARDIEKHYQASFQNTGLKAQLVAPSKYSAILFQQYFADRGLVRTSVVMSDEHDAGDEDSHKKEVVRYLEGIRAKQGTLAKYEKDVIDSFKHNPDGIEIIIVVDKLLTGFDAPRNTVLYLAKELRDHNLLQAIARVNRLYENEAGKKPKTSGYIIDYSENAKHIQTAMQLFGNFDGEDVKGALIDVDDKINELTEKYAQLADLFKTLKGNTDDEAYLQYLGDPVHRDTFFQVLNEFIRSLNECYVLQEFVHKFPDLDLYRRDLKKFMELRKSACVRYAQSIDLSEYRQSLIAILDKYVDAHGVEQLTTQVTITDKVAFDEAVDALTSDKTRAEAIAAQLQRTVKEKMEDDPEYYIRFSEKVQKLIDKMREEKLADIAALKQLKLWRDDLLARKDEGLPEVIATHPGADVLYRNMRANIKNTTLTDEQYRDMIVELAAEIKKEAIVDWYKNADVKRRMKNAVDDYLYDVVQKQKGIALDAGDMKTIIDKTLELAERNYALFS